MRARGLILGCLLGLAAVAFGQHARTIGEPLDSLDSFTNPTFSPNGRLVATYGRHPRGGDRIHVFEATTLKRLWSQPAPGNSAIAFSPDGSLVVASGSMSSSGTYGPGPVTIVFDALSGRQVSTTQGLGAGTPRVSPRNDLVIFNSYPQSSVVRVSTGELLHRFAGEGWFTPEGTKIFNVRSLIDAYTGVVVREFGPKDQLGSIIGSTATTFYTRYGITPGQEIAEFDWQNFLLQRLLSDSQPGVFQDVDELRFEPSGDAYWLRIGSPGNWKWRRVRVKTGAADFITDAHDVDPRSGRLLKTRRTQDNPSPALHEEFTGYRVWLEAEGLDGSVFARNVVREKKTVYGPVDPTFTIRYGSIFWTATVHDPITGRVLKRRENVYQWPWVSGSGYGLYAAVNFSTNLYRVTVLDRNLNMIRSFEHPLIYNQLAMYSASTDGRYLTLLRAIPDYTVEAVDFDVVTGASRAIEIPKASVAVSAEPGSGDRFALIAYRHGGISEAIVYDRPSLQPIRSFFGPSMGEIGRVALSPDGTRIAITETSDTAQTAVYSVSTGERLFRLSEENERSTDLAYTPDGTTILTVDTWGTIRAWNAASGEPTATYLYATGVNQHGRIEAVSPDGKMICFNTFDLTLVKLEP